MITSHNIGHYYLIFSRTNIIFLIPTLVYQKATTFGLWVNANNDTGSVLKILLLNATEFVSFFNWDSPHAGLNNHCKAWSYKKKKHKKLKHKGNLFRKNLQLIGVC